MEKKVVIEGTTLLSPMTSFSNNLEIYSKRSDLSGKPEAEMFNKRLKRAPQ